MNPLAAILLGVGVVFGVTAAVVGTPFNGPWFVGIGCVLAALLVQSLFTVGDDPNPDATSRLDQLDGVGQRNHTNGSQS